MKRLSKRDRLVVTVGGIIVAVFLVGVYGILPLYDSVSASAETLGQRERAFAQRVRAISDRALYAERSQALSGEVERLRAQLLDSRDVTLAQSQLENLIRGLAEQYGVSIQRSTPLQGKRQGDKYSKVTIQINVQAGMAELADFLHALSVHPKYLEVEELYINGFRVRDEVRLQPRLSISGLIEVAEQEAGA
jgi:hypothetical protein